MQNNTQVPRRLGVIIEVSGSEAKVGMYDVTNDSEFIWHGEILFGPKIGAYVTINQGDSKIIAKITRETIIDEQNSKNSIVFDNRYTKNSISRLITLKTQGVILNNKFRVTSKYVPMIGNEVSITTQEEINLIYGVEPNEPTISIGKSLFENHKIQLSINSIFASHLGVFGNTGSGKSNTLHKLFLELFKSRFREGILSNSQFFVIDFNIKYL